MRNTWITNRYALMFLCNYDDNNGPIYPLQMRIIIMHINVANRNGWFLGGANYGSREGSNLWFDQLISQHDAFAATLHKNHAVPVESSLPHNMPGF